MGIAQFFIELRCKGRPLLVDRFDGKTTAECGGGELVWKFNPTDLRALRSGGARLGAGSKVAQLLPAYPAGASLRSEVVAFAPSGLAAGSLKSLRPDAEEPATRLLASAGEGDLLVLALAPATSKVQVAKRRGGFQLKTRAGSLRFAVHDRGADILKLA